LNRIKPWAYDAILSLSASNLCFLRVWSDLLQMQQADMFYFKNPPQGVQVAATCICIVLLAFFFYFVIRQLRRLLAAGRQTAVILIFFVVAFIAVNPTLNLLSHTIPAYGLLAKLTSRLGVVIGAILAGIGLVIMILVPRRVLTLSALILSLLTPLAPYCVVRGSWRALTVDASEYADKPLAPKLQHATGDPPRIVWMIFDELDYRLAFIDRREDVLMPEFDRLRREALFATNAHSPATDTIPSVPALLSGKSYVESSTHGPADLSLTSTGAGGFERWNAEDTIFATARRLGRNTAAVGFYIPYCRLLNDALTDCYWVALGNSLNSLGQRLPQIVGNEFISLFQGAGFSLFGQTLTVKRRVQSIQELLTNARRMVTDPDQGLIFLHFPAPHAPHPYDRFTRTFTKKNAPVAGYWDSLALADVLLGDMRTAMTASGLWDRTTVLVSSDHPHRWAWKLDGKSDTRVPFLLKMPNQKAGAVYDKPLQTLCTRSLLEEVMEGDVNTSEEAIEFLDHPQWRTVSAR